MVLAAALGYGCFWEALQRPSSAEGMVLGSLCSILILGAWSWLLHLGMGALGRRCKDHCAEGTVLGSLCGILILDAWSWLLHLGMGALGRRCKDHCAGRGNGARKFV